jgi:hypothetical protein
VDRVLQGVQDDHQAHVRVADQVQRVEAEVAADGVEVLHVVVDAPGELRGVPDRVRAAAIARVVDDQRAALRQRLEVVPEREAVRDDHGLRAGAHQLEKQARSVIRQDVALR